MTDYSGLSRAQLIERLQALDRRITSDALQTAARSKEQRRHQTALRDSEERLRAILDTAVEGIITIDERGIIESANAAAQKIFGYEEEELIGRNVSVLMPNPYRREHDGYLANYAQTGRPRIIGIGREVLGQRKDGTVFPMDLSVSEVELENQRLFTGFVRDISQRKQSETASRQLAAIVENSGDAIISKNLEGIIATWNQGAQALFGYSQEEMIGKSILTIIPPSRHAEEQHILQQVREGKRITHYETIRQRKDGSLVDVSLTVSPIKDAEGRIVGVSKITRDISERRRLEQEVLEISERERRGIGHTLHDGLSQHLAGIELMSRALEQKLAKRSKAEAVQAAKIAEHVRDAIGQTRMVARGLSPVSIESNGLMSALQELATTVSRMFGIECRFECPEPILIGDNTVATHLYRIVQEAINNGVKHGKTKKMEIRMLRDDSGLVQLSVTDWGKGFAKGAPNNGAGMGLQIMKYRANMVGASLDIQDLETKGVRVVCTLKAGL
jgi:PAS domain S-box-containing protein